MPDEEIPKHLSNMLRRSKEELDPEEKEGLKALLIVFQDVFTKDDYDFGNFTAVENKIDTGSAPPVKHKLRRTLMSFVEEKSHLD